MGRRAFRRPVTDADLKPLLAFYRSGREERDFDFGIEKALRALLVSPDFLFRIEQDPRGAARPAASIASAISNWRRASPSSCGARVPDDQLLDLAEKGKLKDPAVLDQQVRRMLDDPRAESLVSQFRRAVALHSQSRAAEARPGRLPRV